MLRMDIYKKGKKIESKIFWGDFCILKDFNDDNLFWRTSIETDIKPGVIRIWIQTTEVGYRILHVLPDWQLAIDGVQLPQKFYDTVEITGKHIRLRYGEYEFECQFPKTE